MFDNEAELENLSDTEQRSGDKDSDATPLAQWCGLLSMIVFCLVYFPFKHHPWSLAVALAVSYTVFVFGIALSLVLKDADDFFGDPRVPGYVTTLLLPHAPHRGAGHFGGVLLDPLQANVSVVVYRGPQAIVDDLRRTSVDFDGSKGSWVVGRQTQPKAQTRGVRGLRLTAARPKSLRQSSQI